MQCQICGLNVENEQDLAAEVFTARERIERTRERENKAEEDDEEEAHLVHHGENHAHKVADLAEVAQEVEQFEEQEECGAGVYRLLDLQKVAALVIVRNLDTDRRQIDYQGDQVDT
eukprot:CAMPEP_0185597890 /NCGR_PEP_ID=MMETSP0434-20130131/81649_1 /TAXON_ID=626734 ORGANISM="Favella taraikaensis, Strain Fe Narragansett Bay" /NCGR_SAMPLE_ID=MMETSP0434 /ASSEMBLY_ACC=CAM_ASM_000379 /LENGTH=115 /DNA_ID=CAMNT_0028226729 /DNA_START=746 /DNA_END=1094 /DNA_ORIENTATION=+